MTCHKLVAFGIALHLCFAVFTGCFAQTPAGSPPAWPTVASAISRADHSQQLDCPSGRCGAQTSALHSQRLADYQSARDMLLKYMNAQPASLQADVRLRLVYRLAQVYEGAEEYKLAETSYEQCAANSASATEKTGDGTYLRDVCKKSARFLHDSNPHQDDDFGFVVGGANRSPSLRNGESGNNKGAGYVAGKTAREADDLNALRKGLTSEQKDQLDKVLHERGNKIE